MVVLNHFRETRAKVFVTARYITVKLAYKLMKLTRTVKIPIKFTGYSPVLLMNGVEAMV